MCWSAVIVSRLVELRARVGRYHRMQPVSREVQSHGIGNATEEVKLIVCFVVATIIE